jgi:DNA helicase-2/ATP-dependent DNA helicase PcrA
MERIKAGLLHPESLLQMQHLIVDEFQDLNPTDLEFIYSIINRGVNTFVAGDDDQSIYSFRFASPAGIQTFPSLYPNSGQHELRECFRCTPRVLEAATTLIGRHPLPGRIPKNLSSLWNTASPPVIGVVHRWYFSSDVSEARAIAESCRVLVGKGVPPREILILLGNSRRLLSPLKNAFNQIEDVDFEPPHANTYIQTVSGRFVLGLIRLVCDTDDYVAYRIILGLRPGVGAGTCNEVAELVTQNNLNYRDVFHHSLPEGVFTGRALSAINHARNICSLISDWQPEDTLERRSGDIVNITNDLFDAGDVDNWQIQTEHLPGGMSLEEFRNYLWADTDEQQASLLTLVYERLGLDIPEAGVLPQRVRAMTMHGAKGLNASVVFIPGLEEGVLPNSYQRRAAGLVLEAARLLYVSITRARVACIFSYSTGRVVHGKFSSPSPSRFNTNLAGAFVERDSGLSQEETEEILGSRASYFDS